MTRIAFVTDSTAYLPPELLERYHIRVVPLYVLFGQEALKDNVDITSDAFYARLAKVTDKLPTTSQPSAGDFKAVFQEIIDSGQADAIVAILISSILSGTVASAQQAKEMFPSFPIHVVDTLSTSMALGYVVLAAARAAEAGASLDDVLAAAQAVIPKLHLYFAVDTLKYLHMGGRIGGASVLLGTALGIKPLLELRNGRIEAAGKVRSRRKAHEKLVDIAVEAMGEGRRVRAATLSAADEAGAKQLIEMLCTRLECVEKYTIELSPCLGVHTGPGTVGIVVLPVD